MPPGCRAQQRSSPWPPGPPWRGPQRQATPQGMRWRPVGPVLQQPTPHRRPRRSRASTCTRRWLLQCRARWPATISTVAGMHKNDAADAGQSIGTVARAMRVSTYCVATQAQQPHGGNTETPVGHSRMRLRLSLPTQARYVCALQQPAHPVTNVGNWQLLGTAVGHIGDRVSRRAVQGLHQLLFCAAHHCS